jgi:hypothetical protein
VLGSMKVLISKDDLRDYRGAGVKRIIVTAIEYISANGRSFITNNYLASHYPSKQLDHVPHP